MSATLRLTGRKGDATCALCGDLFRGYRMAAVEAPLVTSDITSKTTRFEHWCLYFCRGCAERIAALFTEPKAARSGCDPDPAIEDNERRILRALATGKLS